MHGVRDLYEAQAITRRRTEIENLIPNSSQLNRNMVTGVACSLISAVLMAVSYPLYLRYLGYEQYGLWLVLATVLGFAQLSNLGLGLAVSKQVAADHALGDSVAVDSCVSTALCALLVSGGIVSLLVALFRMPIATAFRLSPPYTELVIALLPAVGLLSLYAIYLDTFSSTLAGIGRIDLFNIVQVVNQLVSVLSSLLFLHLNLGVMSFVLGNSLGFLIAHLTAAMLLHRQLGRTVFRVKYFSFPMLRKTLKLSVYLMGCSALNMMVSPLNKLLLSRFIGVSVLPTYDIIVSGSMKLRSLIEAGLRALMPEVSRLAAEKNYFAITQLNRKVGGALLLGGGFAYGVLLVVCGVGVNIWLGKLADQFPTTGLRVVLFGTFLSLLGVPAYYTLLGLGKSATLFVSNVIQSAAPLLCNLFLVLVAQNLSFFAVLSSVALGMGLSTAYLVWQNKRALSSIAAHQEIVLEKVTASFAS